MIEESLEGTEVVLEKYQDDIVSDNNIWTLGTPYKDIAGKPTEWFRIFECSNYSSLTAKSSEKITFEGIWSVVTFICWSELDLGYTFLKWPIFTEAGKIETGKNPTIRKI